MPQRECTFSTQPMPSVKTYTLNFDPCSNLNNAEIFFYTMLMLTTAYTDPAREESKWGTPSMCEIEAVHS